MKHEEAVLSDAQEARGLAAAAKHVRATHQIASEVLPAASPTERLQMVATLAVQGIIREAGLAAKGELPDDAPGVVESLLMGIATASGMLLGRIGPESRPASTRLFLQNLEAGCKITAAIHDVKGSA